MTDTSKRRKHSAEFKARVAIEALQERSSLTELSKKYGIHPNMITKWKTIMQESGFHVFKDAHPERDDRDKKIDELHRIIGELSEDNEFFKKKLKPYL